MDEAGETHHRYEPTEGEATAEAVEAGGVAHLGADGILGRACDWDLENVLDGEGFRVGVWGCALSRIIGDTKWKHWSLFIALLLRLHVEVAVVRAQVAQINISSSSKKFSLIPPPIIPHIL